MDSEGQRLISSLHEGDRARLEVSPNLWAGVGLVRTGAGTALIGDPDTVAARMKEYADLGIESFILSGYPHLEEAYTVAELLFPKNKKILQMSVYSLVHSVVTLSQLELNKRFR